MAASVEHQSGMYDLYLTVRDIRIANSNSQSVVSQAHDIRYMPSLTTFSFSSQLPPYLHNPHYTLKVTLPPPGNPLAILMTRFATAEYIALVPSSLPSHPLSLITAPTASLSVLTGIPSSPALSTFRRRFARTIVLGVRGVAESAADELVGEEGGGGSDVDTSTRRALCPDQ